MDSPFSLVAVAQGSGLVSFCALARTPKCGESESEEDETAKGVGGSRRSRESMLVPLSAVYIQNLLLESSDCVENRDAVFAEIRDAPVSTMVLHIKLGLLFVAVGGNVIVRSRLHLMYESAP